MSYWYRRVFQLAIPLILSNLTQPLLSTVDTILSGHLPGAAALGGVAMGGIFFNAVFWTFAFLRMSTTGLVAQARGAGQHDHLQLHFLRALVSAFLIGAIIVALRAPLISLSLHVLGAGNGVLQNAQIYCRIRIWAAPAALANYAILGYLLGRQRARTALLLQAMINAVNVGVALFLVLHLQWGLAGIATATMVADISGCVLGLAICYQLRPAQAQFRGQELVEKLLHGPSLRHLFTLNRDILLRTLGLVAAYGAFTRVGARAGDTVLAANAVLMNFHWIASYGLDGFANATEALVGEAIGARRIDHFRAVLRASTTAAFIVASVISLTWLGFGSRLIPLFTNQPEVRQLALQFLPWAVLLPVISVWGFQLDGVFIGATHARDLRDSMLLSLAGFLGLVFVLAPRFGNNGLWGAFAVFMSLRGLTLGMRLPRIYQMLARMPAQIPGLTP
ncbi:MATE family efflux transporter [Acidicapsa ligni]|uniref:MATE family efflux transporter n=1 Tax=Acidicapsa ligni TaxID=542300 RepID=UPI0021E05B4A|nr:MATE family efflux transporter [Acidicapsa ligni]